MRGSDAGSIPAGGLVYQFGRRPVYSAGELPGSAEDRRRPVVEEPTGAAPLARPSDVGR